MGANFFRHLAAKLAQLLPGRRVDKAFTPAESILPLEIPNSSDDNRHFSPGPLNRQASSFSP